MNKTAKQIIEQDILEFDVHEAIAEYIDNKYPGVIYHTDPSGLAMTKAQAGMLTRLQQERGWPDLFIAEPAPKKDEGEWHGCFIELKRPSETIWLQDGTISKRQHIQEQLRCLEKLRAKGYYTNFAIGFDEAKLIVDMYLGGKL